MNSDPDVIACSQGGLFVASSGDARQLSFLATRSDGTETRREDLLAFGGPHFLDPTCTYDDLNTISPGALPHPPLTRVRRQPRHAPHPQWRGGALN